MRLGLIGPASNDAFAVGRAARFLLEDVNVERAIYLGVDRAMDEAIGEWAGELVGDDPNENAVWQRALARCLNSSSARIDEFLASERQFRNLRIFETLPGNGVRVVELLGGKMVVMIHDKADLDEEDILPATLLVYGRSPSALIKQIGNRWFVSPGPLASSGVMLLEDRDDGVRVSRFDAEGAELDTQQLSFALAAKMKIASE